MIVLQVRQVIFMMPLPDIQKRSHKLLDNGSSSYLQEVTLLMPLQVIQIRFHKLSDDGLLNNS